MILVTGASGANGNGSQAVKLLAKQGQKVRVMARTPEKVAELAALPGVEVVQGDFSQPESLAAAFSGIDKLYLISGNDPHLVEHQTELLEVAKKAGIKHIVRFSVYSLGPDSTVSFLRWHYEADQQLIQSGLPYTILRPNAFMQNLVSSYTQAIMQYGAVDLPTYDGKISFVDCRDIAEVAVDCLTQEGQEGKIYELTGAEAITLGYLVEKLSVALDKPIAYYPAEFDKYQQNLLGYGVPEWLAHDLAELDRLYSLGEGKAVTTTIQDIIKRPPRTIKDFARDYAPVFKGESPAPLG